MISDCVMWVGNHTSTYQDEIDEWYALGDDIDKAAYHCDEIWIDSDNDMFVDSGGMFSDKTVLFIGAEEWSSADAQWVLKQYDNMDCDVRVAMVFKGDDPARKVAEWATEDVRVRRIPFDPQDMADWIQQWMKKRKVLIERDDAVEVAEHVRYDVAKLVQAINMITSGSPKGRVSRKEIIELLGPLGETELQDLTNGIVRGDRALAAESYQRLAHLGQHYLFHILSTRMRAYSALAFDRNADLTLFGFYGGAQYYIKREAKLSEKQAIRVLQIIAQYERKLKGFDDGLGLDDSMMMFIDSLAMIFARAMR